MQYKPGPERLTLLGNSNVLWLPVIYIYSYLHIRKKILIYNNNLKFTWANLLDILAFLLEASYFYTGSKSWYI